MRLIKFLPAMALLLFMEQDTRSAVPPPVPQVERRSQFMTVPAVPVVPKEKEKLCGTADSKLSRGDCRARPHPCGSKCKNVVLVQTWGKGRFVLFCDGTGHASYEVNGRACEVGLERIASLHPADKGKFGIYREKCGARHWAFGVHPRCHLGLHSIWEYSNRDALRGPSWHFFGRATKKVLD